MHYWHYSIGNFKHEGNLSWKNSSHERGYISYCVMPSYILNDQYDWFSRTYLCMLFFIIMKYKLYVPFNSYNNIETICNPISYIQHDIQHYVQQYAISRITSQWCIEYHQKLQTDFLCAKLSFSDSAIYYMAWIL